MFYAASKALGNGEAFFYTKHAYIWGAMCALIADSQPIDLALIAEHLRQKEQLDDVGGWPYMMGLISNTASSRNAAFYAEMVKRAYIRRQIMQNADNLKYAAADESLPTEALAGLVEEQQSIYAQLSTDPIQHISVAADKHMDMVQEAMTNPGANRILSGWPDLNNMISGFLKRKVIDIAGLSHHGKTAVMLSIAIDAARAGNNVAFFNVADGDEVDVLNRIATMISKVPTRKLVEGTLTPKEYDDYILAMGIIGKLPIYIKSEKGMSPGKIRAECKVLKGRDEQPIRPDIIIIDYIQRMKLTTPTKDKREMMMIISQALTKLGDASNFDCPVVRGAQIRDSARKKDRPRGTDMQESADIFQDSDVCIVVYKESEENPNCENPNAIELIVDKNKQTGTTGTINCFFDKESASVMNGTTHEIDLGDKSPTTYPHYSDK